MLKTQIDEMAVKVTDEIAGSEGSIEDAAAVMLQILGGCEAHLEGIKDFAEDEHDGVLSDIRQMERAIYNAKMALLEMKTVSKRTGGAL